MNDPCPNCKTPPLQRLRPYWWVCHVCSLKFKGSW